MKIRMSVLALSLLSTGNVMAEDTLLSALTEGEVKGNFRLRYERVDDDALDDAGQGLTLRSRLGYGTKEFKNVGAYLEYESNIPLSVEDYNDGAGNGNAGEYPVIADPQYAEVNQAYLTFSGIPKSKLTYGRQRIIFDGARFIGNVGWRQNEQTYDSALFTSSPTDAAQVKLAYIWNVNRIFGDESTGNAGNFDVKSILANGSYKFSDAFSLSAYSYMIEFVDNPNGSNKTFGLSATGKVALNEKMKLMYHAEFAKQSEYDDSPERDLDYMFVEPGINFGPVSVFLGYESLGSDGTMAFSTPFATLHKFNGWADKFLGTPGDGLVDTYVKVVGKVDKVKLVGFFHTFSSDENDNDYGTEFDFLAVRPINKHVKAGLKYAAYSAGDDGRGEDISKLWAFAELNF